MVSKSGYTSHGHELPGAAVYPPERPPAYLALDLWMALGLSSRDFDAYLERNGWADTWANLLDGVRRKSGRRGCSKPRERCVLIAGHVGPCMGASDVGSSERLPGAAFGGEQDD